MPVPITALYAGILTVIAIVLGFRVGRMRLKTEVSLLHGESPELLEEIRRHANFTEAVPMALILLALIELNGASGALLHGLGLALVAARIAHPIGLHHDNMRHPLRGVGALGTIVVTVIAAGVGVWQFLGA